MSVAETEKKSCVYLYLGKVDYMRAWEFQRALLQARAKNELPNILLLLQHPHTITMGKTGSENNLLIDPVFMAEKKIAYVQTDRGGDVTYHGPGQLVGYPILLLSEFKEDVIWYLRQLEEVVIRVLQDFAIPASRSETYTGVWVDKRKIAAIGIRVSRWVTMHGFALNVSPDLNYFKYIVPCGIRDRGVCSMVEYLERPVEIENLIPRLVNHFSEIFGTRMVPFNPHSWPLLNELMDSVLRASPEL